MTNDKVVMLKDLSPGDEFKRFSGEHRYVVSSHREEHCGNVAVFCYNLTNGKAYDWAGSTRVVPLRRGPALKYDGGAKVTTKPFREVTRIPICLEKGRKYQVEIQGNEVVISKEVEWKDVTKSCYLEFRDSQHCNGRYIAIWYKDGRVNKMVAVIGFAGIQVQSGFRVEKPSGAFTSFRILKKNR